MVHSTIFKEEGEIEGKLYTKKVEGKSNGVFKTVVTIKDISIEDVERFTKELGNYFSET